MVNKKDILPDIQVSEEKANEFWKLLDARHPDIGNKIRLRQITKGKISFVYPPLLSNDEVSILNRFIVRWYSDNKFRGAEPDFIYVSMGKDETSRGQAIDTSTIISMNQVEENLTDIVIKDFNDLNITLRVKEPIEWLKKQVYIF